MATTGLNRVQSRAERTDYPESSLLFDLLVSLGGLWFLFGLYLDGWAHSQPGLVDTFWTPWHAVLYSGFLSMAALIGVTQLRNMWRGHAIFRALPRGYLLALIGVIVFASGAPFDFLWHSWFGFEENLEALLSPSHLILATGALLVVGAPLRSAWQRQQQTRRALAGWRELLPATLSVALMVGVLMFFWMYGYILEGPGLALVQPTTGRETFYLNETLILKSLAPILIMLPLGLIALRSFRLPLGAWTLMFGLGHVAMYFMRIRSTQGYELLFAAYLAVIALADVVIWRLRIAPDRPVLLRAFCFGLPVAYLLAGFVVLLRWGLFWEIHMWLGMSVLMGGLGLLLSYLIVPSPSMLLVNPE